VLYRRAVNGDADASRRPLLPGSPLRARNELLAICERR
jgi:hypothetical protein